jgi:hypothetical protein
LVLSHDGGSAISRASSVFTMGDQATDKIVELVRGKCLVIFARGSQKCQVVCAGKYVKCQIKEHKMLQKEERSRGKPSWFHGVLTQGGRLIGGWLDSRMTAAEVALQLEARKQANWKNAVLLTSGS